MARPLRIEFPGALYHVTSRGDGQETIYEDDEDRRPYLEILGDVVERFVERMQARLDDEEANDVNIPRAQRRGADA